MDPVLGSTQVTHATKPGENQSVLGTGTLLEFRESITMAVVAFDCDATQRAFLEQEKYQYDVQLAKTSSSCCACMFGTESIQQCHVVVPCLELQEFKELHARRIHGLGITVEALIEFAYKHDCWQMKTQDYKKNSNSYT